MIKGRIGLLAYLVWFALGCTASAADTPCPCIDCARNGRGAFRILSDAMAPTLLPGDCVTMQRVADPTALHRGDIIAFTDPARQATFIYRLIGIARDRIQMKQGRLWLNGTEVPQRAMDDRVFPLRPQGPMRIMPRCLKPTWLGGTCVQAQAYETLPSGVGYRVLDVNPQGWADETSEFQVPDGHVFVLGDHRDNSIDSRFSTKVGGPGMIEQSHIVGVVLRLDDGI